MYTNADSIANKWSELETLVYIHQPDIIGITEIFPKDFELSSYVLKGFQQIMNRKYTDKSNRGAIIFVRDGLEVKSFEKLNNIACKEAVWCEISVSSHSSINRACYRSPNSSEENNCKLNELMSSINEENHAYKSIMGNYDYKDIDWKHCLKTIVAMNLWNR